MRRRFKIPLITCGLLLSMAASSYGFPADNKGLRFEVAFDQSVDARPFTGRILVLLTKQKPSMPAKSPNWFRPEPMFAIDVRDLHPGATAIVDDRALSYPQPLSRLPVGVYWAQAVLDFGQGMSYAAAESNGYSDPVPIDLNTAPTNCRMLIKHVYHETPFKDSARFKLVDIESRLLSAFHGRSIHLRAAVVVPDSFNRVSEKHYPVVYVIPGFGGNHFSAGMVAN